METWSNIDPTQAQFAALPGASWFETRERALLTMRIEGAPGVSDVILRRPQSGRLEG
jgi:hypothetical protein